TNGATIVGGNRQGNAINHLYGPNGLYVDDDQTIYIVDFVDHRIVEYKCGATTGRVVIGEYGSENRSNQLNTPTDMIIDKEKDSLIICNYNNKRVVRWSRQNGTNGKIIISNVGYHGLTMDDDGFFYVADCDKHEVIQYRMGQRQEIVVAGGNGEENRLDQLHAPRYIFVDRDHSIYVSDGYNHRVMIQLSNPYGIVIDQSGTVYVADNGNYRIMHWSQGATQGSIIVGGNGQENQSNQLNSSIVDDLLKLTLL
ncbi:unnamed protein product, partial [Rotaria sordida]